MLVVNHLLLLLLLPIVQSRKLRQLGMEDEMMTENKIDSNSLNFGENADDMSSEESLQETSIEEDRQAEYLDEEEPPSNAVDLGEDMPKRRNWFDRCGDCEGVPEDQVLYMAENIFLGPQLCHDFQHQVCGLDGKTYENSCELEYFSCRRYWAITEVNHHQSIRKQIMKS